jgi:DNA repair exonuclease SbcCD ATPase subunit
MKNITFKKLLIKNFLSVGDTPVEVEFRPGLHIITGINKDKVDRRNGVGKSTIADALYFALYGSTLRELKKEFICNNISPGRCEVSLTIVVKDKQQTNEYTITRLLNPTKCYIYKNGQDCTRDTILNTTDYINKLINTSEDVFQNCIIMTVNNTVPFMAKKRVDKRKFIEGILNLEVFSSMINMLRNEYNEKRRDLETECTIYDEVQTTLKNYTEQKNIHDANKATKLGKYKKRQSDNVIELETLNDSLREIKKLDSTEHITKIDVLNKRLAVCNEKINTTTTNIIEHKTNISNYLSQLETLTGVKSEPVCPTCLRKIDSNDKNHIDNEKNNIKQNIKISKKSVDELDESLSKLENVKHQLKCRIDDNNKAVTNAKLIEQQRDNYKTRRAQLISWQKELVQDIDELNNQSNQFDTLIKDTNNRIISIEANIKNIKNVIKDLDVVKFIVSEEGVKSYIVKKILQLLNSKLSYYLKKMDSNCILFFNEYFEEQIVDDKGKICSYFNFSGAERKNIDLACLFTFMDIRRLQGDVSFNVSMYDELFDSSLDEKGVDHVINILKERLEKYNECMYVISHRKESVNFTTQAEIRDGEIIYLQKENGITTRIPFNREMKV